MFVLLKKLAWLAMLCLALDQIFRLEFGNVGDGGSGDWLLVSLLVVIWLLVLFLVACISYFLAPLLIGFSPTRCCASK